MLLHADEDVDDELIRNVVESLVKVADTALGVLFEHLELRVLLVQLVSNGAANDVREHRLESLLVTVVILDRHEALALAFLLALAVCLLAHDANGLVSGLDLDRLDVTDWDSINHCSLLLLLSLTLDSDFLSFDLFGGKVSSAARISKAFVDALSLTHRLVSSHDVLRGELLSCLIWDSLQLFVLHLTGDGLLSVGRHRIFLVLQQLLLNRLNRVIQSVTVESKSY